MRVFKRVEASGQPHSRMADDVTVVLPTLNEEDAIGSVIDEIRGAGYDKVLVVDGYSKDRTVEIARSKGVTVISQHGEGKAGAIRTAIENVKTKYMLVMDADETYDPNDISKMVAAALSCGDCDEVIGWRRDRRNIPLAHRFGNWVLGFALSLMMGRRVNDPCSGIYLLKTEVARRLELTATGFGVEAEIVCQICAHGRLVEVPVSYRKRKGVGKLRTWRDGLHILGTIIKMMWLYNPVFMFSAFASLSAVPGLIILLQQLTLRYLYGAEAWSLGWAWLGLVLLIIGLQGLSVATISLQLKRLERRMLGTIARS
ncbi:MAG: glycosyltransferase family 2 protein [Candidatus Bathyarchaeota archaeon]|nr:glycosyltransferase family 2 protein [Candidatus Bathyarchaeota archaeon]